MRRRFLGQRHSSKCSSSKPIPIELAARKSFSGEGSTSTVAAADYSGLMAENKYATIGRFAKKWPLGAERADNPLMARGQSREALNGGGGGGRGRGRPRSMGGNGAGGGGGGGTLFDSPGDAADHRSTSTMSDQISPGALFHPSVPVCGNNRNSTGSTNSSQTSSGFESAKSSSSHQLATSISSGSCSSGIGSAPPPPLISSAHPSSATPLPASSPSVVDHPARPSSRLSSTGSSTQGRSSAYFSLSDGLDPSSADSGGTLTAPQKNSTKGVNRRGNCPRVNIAEMVAKGIPEPEIFAEWLQRLCLSDYLTIFLAQGYDLATLARASPEDLTTLGITRPDDRKRLVQDIQCWRNLPDRWPVNFAPDSSVRDWLSAIGLKQYVELFEQQGYLSMGELEQLEAEDLEDIGVQKQGHIKRICLALKKLKLSRAHLSDNHHPRPQPHHIHPDPDPSFCSATLRPSALVISDQSPSSSTLQPILRRHSQPQQQPPLMPSGPTGQRISFTGISMDQQKHPSRLTMRDGAERSVQFRNSSFGMDHSGSGQPRQQHQSLSDRGPPRLNLYRTSQIIAQLPREPPPELDDDDEEDGAGLVPDIRRHVPPPPAPMPLSPVFLPGHNATVPSSSRLFCSSISQPTTPRNVQRLFAPPASDFSIPIGDLAPTIVPFEKRIHFGRTTHDLDTEMESKLSLGHPPMMRR